MSPENPDNAKSELDKALEELGENIKNKERNSKAFESEAGFHVSITFYNEGLRNVSLEKSGLTSLFSVEGTGVRLMELRGPDGEHIDDAVIAEQHANEAWALYEAGKFEKFSTNEDGQHEMDI